MSEDGERVPCHCCGGEGQATVRGTYVQMSGRCLCCRGERTIKRPDDPETDALWARWRAEMGIDEAGKE